MQDKQLPIQKRVGQINWANYETAFGVADSVPDLIVALASDDKKTSMSAANALWCGLCHQHAYASSAALPSYPFLLEIHKTADVELSIEILDILCGFALCSHPKFPTQSSRELEWRTQLRRDMTQDQSYFSLLFDNEDEVVVGLAKDIVGYILAEELP